MAKIELEGRHWIEIEDAEEGSARDRMVDIWQDTDTGIPDFICVTRPEALWLAARLLAFAGEGE